MNKIYTDSYFHIGEQHLATGLPNQDYALAGAEEGYAYAIVSDGCSSGGKTDVGSRILAHATQRALRSAYIQGRVFDRMRATRVRLETEAAIAASAQLLNLALRDLLATLLYAVVGDAGGYIRVYGDGVVVVAYQDGSMTLRSFSWKDNMPFYLAYTNDALASFKEAHGNDLWKMRLIEHVVHVQGDGVCEKHIEHTLAEGIYGIHLPVPRDEVSQVEYIALFSDGVEQIEGELWVDAARELMRYKIPKGVFVKRRMIRGLKEYRKKGKRNLDDIASAVIRLAHEEEE